MNDDLGLRRFRLPEAPTELRDRVLAAVRGQRPRPAVRLQKRARRGLRLAWAVLLGVGIVLQVYIQHRQARLQRMALVPRSRPVPAATRTTTGLAWYQVRTDRLFLRRLYAR